MAGMDGKIDGPLGGQVVGVPKGWVKVRATRAGTYPEPGVLIPFFRSPGDEFIVKEEHYSSNWMQKLDPVKPPPPLPEAEKLPQTTLPGRATTYGPAQSVPLST